MKTLGRILTTAGLVASIIFGIQAYNDSQTFSILGADVAVSSADWTPFLISAGVLVIGLIMVLSSKKS